MDIFDCSIYSEDSFIIRINEDKNRKELKEYLYNKYGKYQANNMLNMIILGEISYLRGYLSISKIDNSIINVKDCCNKTYVNKRIYYKEYYIEKKFVYDKKKDSYSLKIIKNTRGIKEDISNEYDLMREIKQLIIEADNISLYLYVNILEDDVIIIDGKIVKKEIEDDEISLYSCRSEEELNSCMYQRLYIVKKETNKYIGNITYDFNISNISYFVHEFYRGHRYATKALKLMLELIKNNINFLDNNLYILILSNNIPSIKTAEECNVPLVSENEEMKRYLVNPHKKGLTLEKK